MASAHDLAVIAKGIDVMQPAAAGGGSIPLNGRRNAQAEVLRHVLGHRFTAYCARRLSTLAEKVALDMCLDDEADARSVAAGSEPGVLDACAAGRPHPLRDVIWPHRQTPPGIRQS